MPIEHPQPTQSTVKELYANAISCGFSGCSEPLFVVEKGRDKRSLNSRIAHICARREGGPRWDPSMSASDNRSAPNLLLLCVPHASSIDLLENVDRYQVELLREWKAAQLTNYDAARGGWALSDAEADEVLQASVNMPVTLQAETINLGGTGGSAVGASGGGGGAIGSGAIGGAGGPVGHIDLDGTDAPAPGAGGGGGGAMSAGAIVPEASGGSGVREGRGFSTGVDGQAGGESFVATDRGEVLLRAPGGHGGLAGTGVRLSSDRFSVSTLMLVNYAEAPGLVSVIGGAWQNCSLLNVPTRIVFPVLIVFEAGGVPSGEYTAGVEVRGPDQSVRCRISFPITIEEDGDVCRFPRACALEADVDVFGRWTVAVVTSERELARIEVMIKRLGSA